MNFIITEREAKFWQAQGLQSKCNEAFKQTPQQTRQAGQTQERPEQAPA